MIATGYPWPAPVVVTYDKKRHLCERRHLCGRAEPI